MEAYGRPLLTLCGNFHGHTEKRYLTQASASEAQNTMFSDQGDAAAILASLWLFLALKRIRRLTAQNQNCDAANSTRGWLLVPRECNLYERIKPD